MDRAVFSSVSRAMTNNSQMVNQKVMVLDRLIFIWLLLMAATVLARLIGHGPITDDRLASAAVIAVAFLKVRLVGLDFMELRYAPPAFRIAFEMWVLAVGGVLIALSAM
jgi:hypothetical protein